MKISCSTTIGHRLSLVKALDRIRDLGFTDVDLLVAHGWAHLSPRDLVDDFDATSSALQKAAVDRGLRIVGLNVAFSGPLYGRSEEDRKRRAAEALGVMKLMAALGIQVAAIQPGGRPHAIADTVLIERAAESWGELTRIAKETGRTVALELHTGSPFDSPDAARGLVNRVPDTAFAFDPSHLVGEGIDIHVVGWILDAAAQVQLRDAQSGRVQVPYGTGTVDFDWILEKLKARDYRGHIAIEYLDTDEFDVLESTRKLADRIRPYVTE